MLQLNNKTPFAPAVMTFPNEKGVDTIYAVAKARFLWQGKWTLVEEQSAPQEADVYYGEPGSSSLKYASDYHTGKIGTDIVMIGSACAPGRVPVRYLDVSLELGPYRKHVCVFGNRYWDNGRISPPEPFETMRLRYENAFGGTDVVDSQLRAVEARNPVGKGFKGKKSRSEVQNMSLPNLENQSMLIQSPSDCPTPVCFAPLAPNWEPRVQFAGTYDEEWTAHHAPFLPDDYSPRFMNVAATEMWVERGLSGGEPVTINNMHPEGEISFNLPQVKLGCRVDLSGRIENVNMAMETVILEPNKLEIAMLWRGSLTCDKQMLKVREVELFLAR